MAPLRMRSFQLTRIAGAPLQVLVGRPGQQLGARRVDAPPGQPGVLVEVARRDVELAAREIALVAVDGLEHGAAVSGASRSMPSLLPLSDVNVAVPTLP